LGALRRKGGKEVVVVFVVVTTVVWVVGAQESCATVSGCDAENLALWAARGVWDWSAISSC